MLLPETFTFNQNNLQSYLDCQYRFYLREIHHLEWPAVESEPIRKQEELMNLGTRFHLLCQQYLTGIPTEIIESQIDQTELADWWKSFLALKIDPTANEPWVEKILSLPLGGYRLAGKFDLVFKNPDKKIFIYDWKTSLHLPKRLTLQQRMQSKVYPLIVALTTQNQGVNPEDIELIYWYPEFPGLPIRFAYSQRQMESDQNEIEAVISKISAKQAEKQFLKTEHEKTCLYCRFRSWCDRGTSAGTDDQYEADPGLQNPFNLDFDAL